MSTTTTSRATLRAHPSPHGAAEYASSPESSPRRTSHVLSAQRSRPQLRAKASAPVLGSESTAAPPPTPRRTFMPTPRQQSRAASGRFEPSPSASSSQAPTPTQAFVATMEAAAASAARPRLGTASSSSSSSSSRPLSANYALPNSAALGTPVAASARPKAPVPHATPASAASLEARRNARRIAGPPVSSTPGVGARPTTPLSRPTTPQAAMLGHAPDPATPLARPASPTKFRAKITDGLSSRRKPETPGTVRSGTPQHAHGLGISVARASPRRRASGAVAAVPALAGGEVDDETGESSFFYADEVETPNDERESVVVHVRLRPPRPTEKCAWVLSPLTSALSLEASLAAARVQPGAALPFSFDGLHTGSSNRPVYVAVARPLVRAALSGYDAVIFAYGQTASGKTFTLSGDDAGREPGIIPRAVRDVFRGIRQSESTREWLLRASYLEIHNEVVKDLLCPESVPQIRQDSKKGGRGTFVAPLHEEVVTTQAAVRALLARGQENRHVGATDWNERSSRSHTCFKLTLESWERDAHGAPSTPESRIGKKIRISELSLIDLAGSEKYVSQGADRRAEGANINKSLLTLGKVIYALGERSAARSEAHVPYRDSKLTRVLQNSLSGNARVAVVCTINPSPGAVDESLSTLAFAKRVKKVSLHARRNEVDAEFGGLNPEAQAVIVRYMNEAEELRAQLAARQGATTSKVGRDEVDALQFKLDEIRKCFMRGRGEEAGDSDEELDDDASAGPSSPARSASPGADDGDEPPALTRARLSEAQARIAELEARLAAPPVLPAGWEALDAAARAAKASQLQQYVQQLETVSLMHEHELEQRSRPEHQLAHQLKLAEKKAAEQERVMAELARTAERCKRDFERERKAKQRLIRLMHADTAQQVASLRSPAKGSAASLVIASRHAGLAERPASSLGMSHPDGTSGSRGSPFASSAAHGRSPLAPAKPSGLRVQTRARRSVSQDSAALMQSGAGHARFADVPSPPRTDASMMSTSASSRDIMAHLARQAGMMSPTKSSMWLAQDMDEMVNELPSTSLSDLTG